MFGFWGKNLMFTGFLKKLLDTTSVLRILYALVTVAVVVLMIVSYWKIFTMPGQSGWKIFIPVYNSYIMYKICWKPLWFFILLGVPVLSGIISCVTDAVWLRDIISSSVLVIRLMKTIKLSRVFGHGVGFAIGLFFLPVVFYPILAFVDPDYIGND